MKTAYTMTDAQIYRWGAGEILCGRLIDFRNRFAPGTDVEVVADVLYTLADKADRKAADAARKFSGR